MNCKFIDLSSFYNHSLDDDIHHKPGNNLKDVPHGINVFASTAFNVNGLVQLAGSISKEKTGLDYPQVVKNIPVNLQGEKLSFLQGSSWHDAAKTIIGEYRIHYINGHTEIIPIVYLVHVADWWVLPGDSKPVDAELAWKGDNDRTQSLEYSVQLYKYTWINPFPLIEIKTIDFISDGQESAPFLMAITLE